MSHPLKSLSLSEIVTRGSGGYVGFVQLLPLMWYIISSGWWEPLFAPVLVMVQVFFNMVDWLILGRKWNRHSNPRRIRSNWKQTNKQGII